MAHPMWKFKLNYEQHFASVQSNALGIIPFTVKKYYTDVDGTIIDGATLPANLQVKVPFYLMGKNDMDSSFRAANQLTPAISWKMFYFGVGNGYTFLNFTGLNNVKDSIQAGDLVSIYTDDLNVPSYYCWVVISVDNKPAATIVNNADGSRFIDNIIVTCQNAAQYLQQLTFAKVTRYGDYFSDVINPGVGRSPYNGIDDQVLLDIQFLFSPENGLYSYILFNTDYIIFEIKFQK